MKKITVNSKKLKDGFYIEVTNRLESAGIRIHRDTKEQIEEAINMYEKDKTVTYIGQVVNGKLLEMKC